LLWKITVSDFVKAAVLFRKQKLKQPRSAIFFGAKNVTNIVNKYRTV